MTKYVFGKNIALTPEKCFIIDHERSMDMLNSIHQEPSQSYGIQNREVNRMVIWWVVGLLGVLVSLLQLIISWFETAAPAMT